ncbi:hypothetical protein ACH5RR_003109 [Cinchona calisaya]|uniref:Uncharacterized protein n=1 Tax=Cinchona calisaya TaxID=153742 RepID=A0ABD3AU93_9GENT
MTPTAPIACNMIQVCDKQFPTLNASSIKSSHARNNSRPSANSKMAFLFKKTPYSKSAIPTGRSLYPTLVLFVTMDSYQKGIHPNGRAIPLNLKFYEKRISFRKWSSLLRKFLQCSKDMEFHMKMQLSSQDIDFNKTSAL